MRRALYLLIIFICISLTTVAQTIKNPVFDRTDVYRFRVDKVELTDDTTFVYCNYSAEDNSWANISKNTYLEDVFDGKKYPIIKVSGIPFGPEVRNFTYAEEIQVVSCFPPIKSKRINFIEDPNESAFNIYGINLEERYDSITTNEEYNRFYELSHKYDSLGDIKNAIYYKLKQQKSSEYLYGPKSLFCGSIAYDLCLLYSNSSTKKEDNEKALYWGELSLSILSDLPDYVGVPEGDIARIENSLSACCLRLGLYQKALEYGENSLLIRKELFGTNSELYAKSLFNLANVYIKNGNYQKGVDYYSQTCDIYLKTQGHLSPNYYNSVYGLMQAYLQSNNIEKALLLAHELLPICDSIYSKRSNNYFALLSNICLCHYYNNNFEKAIEYAEETCKLSDDLFGNTSESEIAIVSVCNLMRLYNSSKKYKSTISIGLNHPSLADKNYDIALSLSEAYENIKDFNSSIEYYRKAIALCDKYTDDYLCSMDKLGIQYLNNGDYLKAKAVYEKLLCVYDSIAISDSVLYSNILSHVSVVHNDIGNYKEANVYCKMCKEIRYKLLSSTRYDRKDLYGNYLLSIVNLATGMINDEDNEALPLLEEGLHFINQNKEWFDYDRIYARIFSLKGGYLKRKGLNRDALDMLNYAADMQIKIDSLDYLNTLNEISSVYQQIGDYESLIKNVMKAKTVAESIVDENNPLYAQIMNDYAYYCLHIGNFSQAIESARKVIDIYRNTYGYYSSKYAVALNNIGSTYDAIGDGERDKKCKKEALHIMEYIGKDYGILYSSLCLDIAMYNTDSTLIYIDKGKRGLELCGLENSSTMVKLLRNEAKFYLQKLDTIRALDCVNKAISITRNEGENMKEEYADICQMLSGIYSKFDSFQSLRHAEKALQLYRLIFNKNSSEYAAHLLAYAKILFLNKISPDSVIGYIKEASDILISHFFDLSFTMPHKETLTYWNRVLGTEFVEWVPLICSSYNTNQSNKLLYDNLLFTKGLILSIDTGLRQSILSSNDDHLINLYMEFCELSSCINTQLALPYNKKIVNVDSLFSLKEKMGWSLAKNIKAKGYNTPQRYTWKDVRNQLEGNDLAVEFGSCLDKKSNLIYYALAINKKSSCPKLIKLFKQEALDSLINKDRIDSLKLSSIIWKPILKEFSEATNIYFSPFGILSLYGLEYLPIDFKQPADSLTFYRLSSTKELCNRRIIKDKQHAVLYGGINYNSKDGNNVDLGALDYSEEYQDLTRSCSLRGDFEPLVNSEDEINAISSFLLSRGVCCEMYKNTQATEKSFKALSGKSISFLHLATHGMYIDRFNADEKKTNKNLNFIILDDFANNEDRALSRSFLVMSGGNMLMHRDSTLYAEDDGILTALEISQLNLKDLDVVVLSACESALGDITAEGVYGLQRGFKKAGAQTILMSLDKVDDEATKILMVEFYKNLMSGKTKHQSLKDAQKYLRQIDNGKYNKPEYWASFIMLDGLN